MISTIDGWDATSAGLAAMSPMPGQPAGYITGLGDVPWTAAQRADHPGFVQIDQSPALPPIPIADFYDLEAGAITVDEIAEIIRDAQTAFNGVFRPGQRWPGVYCSRSNVTDVVNHLVAGGITSCPLGVADYDFDHSKAQLEVATASGPYPVVWRQYSDRGQGGLCDLDVFSVPWLTTVSKHPSPPLFIKDYDMVILQVTAPASTPVWGGKTRTFTYNGPSSTPPEHIVSVEDQAAFAKELPVVVVSWAQYQEFGGV